jgi:hypothetical protein
MTAIKTQWAYSSFIIEKEFYWVNRFLVWILERFGE